MVETDVSDTGLPTGIADFCLAHDLWLHVDGAHGAALALSPRHRAKVAGIERTDSVVWDAHKLLAMPAPFDEPGHGVVPRLGRRVAMDSAG